jgi:hypothetical protein
MATIAQLRSLFPNARSDEDAIGLAAKDFGLDPVTIANDVGYKPGTGSLTGERMSGSIDSYQGKMYGLGEAVAGAVGATGIQDWMRSGRRDNEFEANVASSRARALGGIDRFSDVRGVGDFANYAGGLAAQMVPYAGEALAGGLAVRGLSTGLRGAAALGRRAEATPEIIAAGTAAGKALNTRAAIGGAAASYPSAVGDILDSQRDQLRSNGMDEGNINLGSAAAGGVPYAALNLLSPANTLLTTGRISRGIGALDNMQGVRGGLTRLGVNTGIAGGFEGANETGQEFANQYFGRMAVDPNETMFNPEANERYLESFAGGATMGGLLGGAAGGWRRSNGYQPPAEPVEAQPDLLARPSVQLEGGLDSYGPEDGPQFALPEDTGPAEINRGDGRGQLGLMSGVYSSVAGEAPIELTTDELHSGRSPAVLAGMQPDLFGAPDVRGTGEAQMLPGEQGPAPDTATGDLFNQTPSATTPTMFDPATEPASVQQNRGIKGMGAVAANIRSQVAQRVGRDGDMTLATALAFDMAKAAGDVGAMNGVIQKALDANAKAMTKLEKQVSGESNMLNPDEYAAARSKLESKLLTIYAAQELAQQHQQANTNALAQEGMAQAQPGTTVGTAPGTEQSAAIAQQSSNEQVMGAKIADTDLAVQEGQAQRSAEQRSQILGDILADGDTVNVWQRFTAELRRQGFTNVAPSTDEIKTITSFHNMMKAQQANAPVAPAQSETDWRAERDAAIGETPAAAPVAKAAPAAKPAPVAKPAAVVKPAAAPAPVAVAKPVAPAAPPVAKQPAPAPVAPPPVEPATKPHTVNTKESDTLLDTIKRTEAGMDALLTSNGRLPPAGSVKRQQWDLLKEQRNKLVSEWGDMTRPQATDKPVEPTVDLEEEVEEQAPPAEKPKAVKPIKRSDYNAEDIAADIDYINHRDAEASDTKSEGKYVNALHDIVNMTDRAVHPDVKAHGESVLAGYPKDDVAKVRAIIKSAESLGNPKFATTAAAPATGMSEQAVQDIADRVLESLGVAAVVQVQVSRNPTAAGLPVPAGVVPTGGTSNGKVYLFADHIADATEAFKVVFHELFHLGLSQTLPQGKYIQTMLRFLSDPLVRKYAAEWKQDADGQSRVGTMPTNNLNALAVEEAMARIGEELNTDGGGIGTKPMRQWVRNMARILADIATDLGFKEVARAIRGMTLSQTEKFVQDAILAGRSGAPVQLSALRFATTTATQGKPDFGGMPMEKINALSKTPFGYAVRDILGGWRGQPWLLGALALNQIQDRFPHLKHVIEATERMLGMGNRVTQLMRVPDTVLKQWASLTRGNKVMAQRLNALLPNASMADMWIDGQMAPQDDPRNKHLDFKDPEVLAQAKELRAEWNALPPAFQKLYQTITKSLTDQRNTNNDAMLKRIVDNHAEALSELATPEALLEMAKLGKLDRALILKGRKQETNPKLYRELQQLVDDINTGYMRPAEVAGPYFPLMREGNNVVVFKAPNYRAIEERLQKAKDAFDEVYEAQEDGTDVAEFEEALKPVRAELTAARAALADAKKDGNLYSVEFYKRMSQAEDRVKELGADKAYRTLKKDFERNVDGIPAGFMTRMTAQLSRDIPKADRAAAEAALKQLILQALPERSALRTGMKRAYVHGVDPTLAMQSFAKVSNRNAWTASRLENSAALTEAIANTRLSENLDERLVGNELAKRYANSMNYHENSPLVDALVNTSYVTHLGFSLGYYLQNMTQPWLVSLPVMAGRFGYRQTAKAIADATADTVKMIKSTVKKDGLSMDLQLDYSMLPEDEQVLLARMTDEGRIDITIRADMGVGQTTATHPLLNLVHSAANLSSWPAQQVEVVNRVATALAAYRLSVSRDSTAEAAQAYAEKMVVQTHVDYTAENAARFMNPNALGGMGRAIWQFKRYQQAMIFLWVKSLQDAMRHGKLADNEAARSLIYLTASNFAIGGAAGIPTTYVFGVALNAMLGLFDDEDERKDYTMIVRKGVADAIGERGADIVVKGLPAGLGFDVSGKLSHGGLLMPVYGWRSTNSGTELGQQALWKLGTGATGGMVANWLDAFYLAKDNPVKAIGGLLPVGFRNILTAAQRTQEGVTTRKGEDVMGAEEFGTAETILKGLGLGETTQVTNMYDKRSALMASTVPRDEVRDRLLKEAAHARGTSKMADVQSDISAFNQRHPDTPIKAKHIQAAWKSRQQNKDETVGGVRVRKQDKDEAERYGIVK